MSEPEAGSGVRPGNRETAAARMADELRREFYDHRDGVERESRAGYPSADYWSGRADAFVEAANIAARFLAASLPVLPETREAEEVWGVLYTPGVVRACYDEQDARQTVREFDVAEQVMHGRVVWTAAPPAVSVPEAGGREPDDLDPPQHIRDEANAWHARHFRPAAEKEKP